MNWISVEEQLPESGETVVVWLGEDGYKLWDTAWYWKSNNEWLDERDEVCYPTHWAPVTRP